MVAASDSDVTTSSFNAGRGPQIRELWESVGKACERKHPTVGLLFQDEQATPAAPTFLWKTKVGRMVGLAPLEEWGELEEIVLRPG